MFKNIIICGQKYESVPNEIVENSIEEVVIQRCILSILEINKKNDINTKFVVVLYS
jgi:hypothetical protein